MTEHEGWSYLDSDNMEEFSERIGEEGYGFQNSDGSGSYYGDDGSWGYRNEDGNSSFYGADGSWGYRNADGSGSYYGEDGSWGYRNADGSGSFYGSGNDWGHWDSDGDKSYYGNDDSDEEPASAGSGGAVAAAIGAGLFAAAMASGIQNSTESEEERAREEERERKERTRRRRVWFTTPAGKQIRKVSVIFALLAVIALGISLFFASLKCVGHSSNDFIGLNHDEAASMLTESGFWNVEQIEISDLSPSQADQDGLVTSVKIAFFTDFDESLMAPCFVDPKITYHTFKCIQTPLSSEEAEGQLVQNVVSQLESAGFLDITTEARRDVVVSVVFKENEVAEIRIGENKSFDAGEEFKPDTNITIIYHAKVF